VKPHITLMRHHIAGKVAEIAFILDEVVSTDWEDSKASTVIAPRNRSSDDGYHPVSRRLRHLTLLAWVSAAGDGLTPMISSRAPIRDSLWGHGFNRMKTRWCATKPPQISTRSYVMRISLSRLFRIEPVCVFARTGAALSAPPADHDFQYLDHGVPSH
jgi:hypothetical protein